MSNSIELENTIIVVSTEIIQKLFEVEDGCDAVALYMFYHKQCKIQKTNQTWTVWNFIKKWLWWWDIRMQKAKRILKSFNLIEDIKIHWEWWKIDGWFVKINYMKTTPPWNPGTGSTTTPWNPPGGSQNTNALSSIKWNALSSIKEIQVQEYGNKDVNLMLTHLKLAVWLDDFKDSAKWQRIYASHLVKLRDSIGIDEFKLRLRGILSDWFKRKNCTKLEFLWGEMKAFIHSPMIEAQDNTKVKIFKI